MGVVFSLRVPGKKERPWVFSSMRTSGLANQRLKRLQVLILVPDIRFYTAMPVFPLSEGYGIFCRVQRVRPIPINLPTPIRHPRP